MGGRRERGGRKGGEGGKCGREGRGREEEGKEGGSSYQPSAVAENTTAAIPPFTHPVTGIGW